MTQSSKQLHEKVHEARNGRGDMEFVDIPGTQLRVSRVALGTWAMGGWMWGGTDERESVKTIWAASGSGHQSDRYRSRLRIRYVRRTSRQGHFSRRSALAYESLPPRPAWKCATARPTAMRPDSGSYGEIDDSLRRLRTDYIDIYQVHWPDPLVPIEETAEAMRGLYDLGKIRAIGVSNFSVEQMERFRQVAPLHVLQPPYNLFERAIEAQILPYCRANNIATFGYGALCRGLLSGRMQTDTTFEGDDLRRTDPKFQPPRFRAVPRGCSPTRSTRTGSLPPAGHSPGRPLDARPGHQRGAVGRPSPGATRARARCGRLETRCRFPDANQPDPQ